MNDNALVVDGEITGDESVVAARRALSDAAAVAGLSSVARTKLITAGSELARNVLVHAGSGVFSVEVVHSVDGPGVRARFRDCGPGIADLGLAMADGFSTGHGLGIGLPGSKRLVDRFEIESAPGRGTVVTIEMWAR